MIEIIFHGRGGQGAVTAAQILATAAFQEGKCSHALPYFRGERKGAPVLAYTRIDENPMEIRGAVTEADIVLVLDGALMKTINPVQSLKPNGLAIVNSTLKPGDLQTSSEKKPCKIETIDATAISEKIYGRSSIPRVNLVMLGYFSAVTKAVKVESILSAIDDYFTGDNGTKAKDGVKMAFTYRLDKKGEEQ